MVEYPHRILGVSENATQDEIKKAYRQKTKEYHPDLHPDDPDAARKMGEINEAYDMLMNPEKYASKRAQQQGYRQYQNQQNYSGQQTGQGYYGNQQNGQYSGNGYGDYGSFTFEDLFGFGGNQGQSNAKEYQNDTPYIRGIVQDINKGLYQQALQKLQKMPSHERTARWYYLSALANKGLGNTVQAYEQIQRAVQMEPNNAEYQRVLRQFQQQQQRYQYYSKEHRADMSGMQQMCMGICAMNLCCNFCMPFRFYI